MRLAIAIVLTLLPPAAAAQVYSWKDANGKIHYTDRPPVESGVQARRLGPATSASSDAAAAQQAAADRRAELAKNAKEAKEKAAEVEKNRAEDEQRAAECQRARANLQNMESGQIRYRLTPGGEREALDGAARDAEIATAQRAVDSWCSPRPAAKPAPAAPQPAGRKPG
jgi:hypothetical protein